MAIVLSALQPIFSNANFVSAQQEDEKNESSLNIAGLVDNLDLSALDKYLEQMEESGGISVGSSAKEYIQALISGDKSFSTDDLLNVLMSALSASSSAFAIISTLVAMCIIWSLATGIEWKNNSNSAKNAVNLACVSTMSVIVFYWIYRMVSSASSYFDDMKNLCDAVFPVFFTLLSASGASGSASALSPVAAMVSVTLFTVIKSVVFPIALAVLCLSMAGSLTEKLPLNALIDFLSETCSRIMKTGFYVFAAFTATQSIYIGIKDRVSLRMGKFALSKYVPIIGGYLSDGFNYVIAGSVLIKNAAGLMTLAIIFMRFIPVLVSLIIASLSLKLVCAIAEPLNVSGAKSLLCKAEKCLSLVRAAITGATFLLIIFVGATMACGSAVL